MNDISVTFSISLKSPQDMQFVKELKRRDIDFNISIVGECSIFHIHLPFTLKHPNQVFDLIRKLK